MNANLLTQLFSGRTVRRNMFLTSLLSLTSLSSFALEKGDAVYTPQGRFVVSGSSNLFKGDLGTLDGLTAVSATEGKEISALFSRGVDPTVGNYIQASTTADVTEGFQYKIDGISSGKSYIISVKLKGPANTPLLTTHNTVDSHAGGTGSNKIYFASAPAGKSLSDEVSEEFSTPTTIASEWTTYNYAISSAKLADDYYLQFLGLNSDIEIADIEVKEAYQVADLRQKEYAEKVLNAYISAWNWTEEELYESGITEAKSALDEITDESTQGALDLALEGYNGAIEGIRTFFEDWFSSDSESTLPYGAKEQALSTIGSWTVVPAKRGYRGGTGYEDYYDLGHYNGAQKYGGGAGSPAGLNQKVNLEPGSYIFSIDARANFREYSTNKCWDNNTSLKAVYGNLYALNANGDTIATTGNYDIAPDNFTSNILLVKIAEAGEYEIGITSRVYSEYTNVALGGALYVTNAAIYAKTNAVYGKNELLFYDNVKAQITAGREALTLAAANVEDANKPWGKSELQAVIDKIEPIVANYEKLDTAAIVEEYSEEYVSSITSESGLLEYEVYQNGVKDILAANKQFEATNQPLTDLLAAIEASED